MVWPLFSYSKTFDAKFLDSEDQWDHMNKFFEGHPFFNSKALQSRLSFLDDDLTNSEIRIEPFEPIRFEYDNFLNYFPSLPSKLNIILNSKKNNSKIIFF